MSCLLTRSFLAGLGLRCCVWAFSSCVKQGLLSSCSFSLLWLLSWGTGSRAHGLRGSLCLLLLRERDGNRDEHQIRLLKVRHDLDKSEALAQDDKEDDSVFVFEEMTT